MISVDKRCEADYTANMKSGRKLVLIAFFTLSFVLSFSVNHECLAATPHMPSCNGAGNTAHNHGNGAPQKCYLCNGEMDTCDSLRHAQEGLTLLGWTFSIFPTSVAAKVQAETEVSFSGSGGILETAGPARFTSRPIYLNNLNLLC